ncbi:MAG: hypothetical protein VXV96_02400 [Bdellovibrionota bacterium]|nr:hypothetical protein [Bdellovibrionota bacterium]
MKGITLLLLLLTSVQVWSQLVTVEADGRFYARDDDRLSFVKNQLLYSAYQDVFSRELKAMNLDSDKFWQHYEEKFAEYFLPIQETIEKKYTDEESGKIKRKADYKKALRLKKLSLKSRYGGLRNAIPRYSVVKRLRSPEVPNSRYIRVKAYVDRKVLHKIYLQFTTDNPDRHFSTLYITPSFQLIDTAWVETGVQVESDLTQVLENSWREKIEASLQGKVDKIVFADTAQSNELENFFRLAKETKELSTPEQGETLANDFGSSLWMKLNFSIKKTKENEDSKKRNFVIAGDLLLMDLSQQKILTYDDFEEKPLALSYEEVKGLSNGVANAIYGLPIGKFRELKETVLNAKMGLKKVFLEIVEYENYRDLELLTRRLGNRGIAKQFTPVIESMTPNSAKISLEYAGEDDEMVALLRGLNNVVLENNRKIIFPNSESPFQLALKKGDEVEKSDG